MCFSGQLDRRLHESPPYPPVPDDLWHTCVYESHVVAFYLVDELTEERADPQYEAALLGDVDHFELGQRCRDTGSHDLIPTEAVPDRPPPQR